MPLCKHRCVNICKYTWDGSKSSAGRGVWILSNDFMMAKPHCHQRLPLLTWRMNPLLRTQASLGSGFLTLLCSNRVTNRKELSTSPEMMVEIISLDCSYAGRDHFTEVGQTCFLPGPSKKMAWSKNWVLAVWFSCCLFLLSALLSRDTPFWAW